MTPACVAKLEAWRAAQADALRVDDLHAAERATIAVAVREAYAAVCTPKQRARLAPAPPAPCSFSDLSRAYMQWRDVLGTTAKGTASRAAADASIVTHGERIAAQAEEMFALREVVRAAAMEIDEPVVGAAAADAAWALIRSVSVCTYGSQGLGAASYARASATLRARDLIEIGYRVRCVARKRPASLPVGPYYLGPIWAWEIYAWTCNEGARIAPHQSPARSIADDLRRARDEGVNPSALWSCVPYRLVQAAGADLASSNPPPAPLAWETLDSDAPLPDVG